MKNGGPESSVEAAFLRRAARAELLAGSSETAVAPLRFAAGLYRGQAALAGAISAAHAREPLSGQLERDVDRVLEPMQAVLRYAGESGPAALAEEARARAGEEKSLARSRLLVYWAGDSQAADDYLSRALLRPYVEILAAAGVRPDRPHRASRCPVCGGAPWVAVRRASGDAGTGDAGAATFLSCALCGGEWQVRRILCPTCGEEDPAKLPSFQSDAYKAVRIEVCETCHRYVKSIDLTLDARPIAEVDDLVSLGMDVWAQEQGYTRTEPGLAGI